MVKDDDDDDAWMTAIVFLSTVSYLVKVKEEGQLFVVPSIRKKKMRVSTRSI